MTTREPDDLRNARVDAAWRAASREEPPRRLDDAIRAAARREIGAKPRSTDASASAVPQSLRPERWWWPLAAAATIGAVAIGLLQLVEPDHVIAPAADKGVVSDTPAELEKKTQEAPATTAATAPPEERQAKQEAPPSPIAPASSAAPARATSAAPRPVGEPTAKRKDVAPPPPREEGARNAAPAPPAPVELGAASAPTSAPPPAAEPFPADKLERESKESAKRDAMPASAAVAPSPASPPAPPADASKPGFAEGKLAATPPSSADSATRRASEAQGVTQAAATKSPARALPTTRGQAFAQTDSAYGGTADVRAKVAPKLSVPDWIELIRKLRGEGKTYEAAKELAAFRHAYADHEQLLPPDLRDWKPAQ